MNTNNNPLHLGISVVLNNSSQPFEMLNNTSGRGWFAPQKYLQGLSGVIKCEYTDTTSSAGDWSGYYAVKHENKISLVRFSQTNNAFASNGYTLETSDKPSAEMDGDLSENEISKIVNDFLNVAAKCEDFLFD